MIEFQRGETPTLTIAEESLLRQSEYLLEEYADVNNKLGLIYYEKGDLGRATDFFKKALSINPGYTEASLNLTVTLNDLGQYHEAKTVLARAALSVLSAPNGVDPYVWKKMANEHARLGDQYIELGLVNQGVEQYQKALQMAPNLVDIMTKLAVALHTQGEDDNAIDLLIQAQKINASYVPAIIQLGFSYYRKGFFGLAHAQWEEAHRIDPENKAVQAYLGRFKVDILAE